MCAGDCYGKVESRKEKSAIQAAAGLAVLPGSVQGTGLVGSGVSGGGSGWSMFE